MRRFLIGTIAIVTSLALMVAGVRAIGHLNRTPESRVFDPGNCSQPCWHGIRPGTTTLVEAEMILRADTNLVTDVEGEHPPTNCKLSWLIPISVPYVGCIFGHDGIVSEIEVIIPILPHEGTPLADVLPAIGSPTAFQICSGASSVNGVMFISDDVEIYIERLSFSELQFPKQFSDKNEQIVTGVIYKMPGSKPFESFTAQTPRWRGFETPPPGYGYPHSRYYLGVC